MAGKRDSIKGAFPADIPRGIEVLIKKAAVDPAFKKLLLERRAEAAAAIALSLSPAEKAMLAAVTGEQLEATIASTKVSPKLKPAFLGYAAAAMLAAVGVTTITRAQGKAEDVTLGITPSYPPSHPGDYSPPVSPEDLYPEAEYSVIIGRVLAANERPLKGAEVTVETSERKISAVTDGGGNFVIENVRLGRWPVKASCPGYGDQIREDVLVIPGYKTDLTFVLSKTDINAKKGVPSGPSIDGIRPDRP